MTQPEAAAAADLPKVGVGDTVRLHLPPGVAPHLARVPGVPLAGLVVKLHERVTATVDGVGEVELPQLSRLVVWDENGVQSTVDYVPIALPGEKVPDGMVYCRLHDRRDTH